MIVERIASLLVRSSRPERNFPPTDLFNEGWMLRLVLDWLASKAKMFSKLSAGVKNAEYFNQAARNVACIAEVISRTGISPGSSEKIGFFVVAPEAQIEDGVFAEHLDPDRIGAIVKRRVSEYEDPDKDKWLDEWFMPTLEMIRIRASAWEELGSLIKQFDYAFGRQLDEFYDSCLRFNCDMPDRFGALSGVSVVDD